MIVAVQERQRLMHQVDQLEGAIADGQRLVREMGEAFLAGDADRLRELRAKAAELHEYAMSV